MRNPFESNPDDITLTVRKAPHETAAVLRLYRAGMIPPAICRVLGMSKRQLQHELQSALDDESEAHRLGLPIHDAAVSPVAGIEKNAKDVEKGEMLLGLAFVESVDVTESHYDSLHRLQDPGHVTIKLTDGRIVSFAPYDKVAVAPKDGL